MKKKKVRITPAYLGLANLFKTKLLKKFGKKIVSVAIYGSVARGTARKDSDVDFLIVVKGFPRSYNERVKKILPILEKIKKSAHYQKMLKVGYEPCIRFIIFSTKQAKVTRPIYIDMVEDALILHDQGLLSKKLAQINKRMQELGSKRVFLPDGSWYWDLKPDLKLGEVFEL